jgi:hypothetical protein
MQSANCPTYTYDCYEMLANNHFTDVDQPYSLGGAFNQDEVCIWEDGIETAELGQFQGNTYVTAGIDVGYTEGVMASANLLSGEHYLLSCSLRVNTDAPESFNLALIDKSTHTSACTTIQGSSRLRYIDFLAIPSSSKQVVVLEQGVNIGTSWQVFTFCFSPNNNYDRIILYPKPKTNQQSNYFDFDDVSLKNMDDIATPVSEFSFIDDNNDDCNYGSVQIGPECAIPGVTYSWSPTTGLSDPHVANPWVTGGNHATTYTLTASYGGGFCYATGQTSESAASQASATITIPDGEDIAWIKSNVSWSSGTPDYVSDKTFYIDGLFTIEQDFRFYNCNFYMGENARIELDGGDFTFENSNQSNFIKACEEDIFWDGIYVDGASQLVWIESTPLGSSEILFSNSENGIVSSNAGGVIVDNVFFDRNHRALQVTPEPYAYLNTVTIYNSKFDCTTPLNDNGSDYFPQYAIEINGQRDDIFSDYTTIVDECEFIGREVEFSLKNLMFPFRLVSFQDIIINMYQSVDRLKIGLFMF